MTCTKDGRLLTSLEEWKRHAGPKSPVHWQDDRSAKEVARAWLAAASPVLPAEVDVVLRSHPHFGALRRWSAEPEVRLPLDDRPGEPRNTDLLVSATDDHGEFLIAVEAKADESFGELVVDALTNALERQLLNPRSAGVARVEDLVATLFWPRQRGEPALTALRYQLLTATAGALRAGADRQVERVVLLVHEFRTRRTTDARHANNARDLGRFAERLSLGAVHDVEAGRLYGPFPVPGAPLIEKDSAKAPALYVGKAVRDLRLSPS